MQPEINDMLAAHKWSPASKLLKAILDATDASDPEAKDYAYNLIVCYIKLAMPASARSMLERYKSLLSQEEVNALDREIATIPTKLKDGEVKEIAFYNSDVRLSDVIGLGRIKKEIRKKIVNAIRYSSVYEEYGASLSSGFVLYGPPGTGKTLLAKAVAGEAGIRMLEVRVNEMISKYQGESSKNLSTLFNQARPEAPVLLFFDEIDSLATNRNSSSISSTGGEDRRILNSLLTELDGAMSKNRGLYLLGATNIPWDIDSAIMRSGRFNDFIYVPPPNTRDREELFKYYISKLKHTKRIDCKKLALLTFGMTPADIKAICDSAAKAKADKVATGKAKNKNLATMDFVSEALKAEPGLIKWYSEALGKLREMDAEKTAPYKALKRDIKFFHTKGKNMTYLYRFAAMFM